MAKRGGVSSKTHTKQKLDAYANQHNPNNKAYRADQKNHAVTKAQAKSKKYDYGILDGESYGWCDD